MFAEDLEPHSVTYGKNMCICTGACRSENSDSFLIRRHIWHTTRSELSVPIQIIGSGSDVLWCARQAAGSKWLRVVQGETPWAPRGAMEKLFWRFVVLSRPSANWRAAPSHIPLRSHWTVPRRDDQCTRYRRVRPAFPLSKIQTVSCGGVPVRRGPR